MQFKGFQIGAKRSQIRAGFLNWSKEILNQDRDYKWGQERLQIGAWISNWGRDYKLVQNIVQQFLITQNPNTVSTPKLVYKFLPFKG